MNALTRIGKYEIRRQVGRGAMGIVFEGFDTVIQRRVAVKMLRDEIVEPSQLDDIRARFMREAQLAGQMSHPHIVTVYDYGEHQGMPYIVMEYMTGSELSKLLDRGTRLPITEVVRVMGQLLGALAYAHERKVVHRDIKPGNLFLLEDGSLKVVDFGIARLETSNLTDTGAILGTPAYMSPEQFLALPVDERSDIFSAGVILYELLTGDKPFTGSVTTIMQKVLHQEPILPSILNPFLSNAWDTVVRQAMAKRADARFQSARQFAEMIKAAADPRSELSSSDATLPGMPAASVAAASVSRPAALVSNVAPAAAKPSGKKGGLLRLSRTSLALSTLVIALLVQSSYMLFFRAREEVPIKDERSAPTQKILLAESAPRAEAAKAAEPATLPKAAAPKAAPAGADKQPQIAMAAEARSSEKALSRSEREAAKAAASRPLAVAPATPPVAATVPAASAPTPQGSLDERFQQAQALEATDPRGAIRLYRSLARDGHGPAAKRLGDIYDRGIAGVSRDYAESLQWYETARALGVDVGPRAARR